MPIELGDSFSVSITGTKKESGRVVELNLKGSVEGPDSVRVVLHNGVSFTIPWEQYERGIDE